MNTPSPRTLLKLSGTMQVPGDKSISHRSLMFSALCPTSPGSVHRVRGLLESADVLATMRCLEQLGTRFQQQPEGDWQIEAPDLWHEPTDILDAQNSGTTMRLMCGLLAPQPFLSILTGDASLKRRPMGRVVSPLRHMGAELLGRTLHGRLAQAAGPDALYAPLVIAPAKSPLQGIEYTMQHASAQLKSALILASLFAEGPTILHQPSASRDHTECMLKGLGVEMDIQGDTLSMAGGQIDRLRDRTMQALEWQVPGDPSSAAFFAVAAALLPGSQLRIEGVGLNPTRIGLVHALRAVGVSLVFENIRELKGEPVGDWVVTHTPLKGNIVLNARDIPALIDEVPILAVAAAFCEGTITITGAEDLRKKESDRIEAIRQEFEKLGIEMETYTDGFQLVGQPDRVLTAPRVPLSSHHDHRIAMALTILNLRAIPSSKNWKNQLWPMEGQEWVSVSYPNFFEQLDALLQA